MSEKINWYQVDVWEPTNEAQPVCVYFQSSKSEPEIAEEELTDEALRMFPDSDFVRVSKI